MDATRKRALSRLERQGLTFDEDQKVFKCDYCKNVIKSRHIANAEAHVKTEKHVRFYYDCMKEQRNDARDAALNAFAKRTERKQAVDRAELKGVK